MLNILIGFISLLLLSRKIFKVHKDKDIDYIDVAIKDALKIIK